MAESNNITLSEIIRRANLFNIDKLPQFVTFSNYGESMTGTSVAVNSKIYPSAFICIYIPTLNSTDAINSFIKNHLVGYYESKLAVGRDAWKNSLSETEKNINPLDILLETIYNFDNSYSIKYISDIVEQDYNGVWSDFMCSVNLNNASNEYKYTVIKTDDTGDKDSLIVRLPDNYTTDYPYNWAIKTNDGNFKYIGPAAYNDCKLLLDNETYKWYDYNTGIKKITKVEETGTKPDYLTFNVLIPLYDRIVDEPANPGESSAHALYLHTDITGAGTVYESSPDTLTEKSETLYNTLVPYGMWFSGLEPVKLQYNTNTATENYIQPTWTLTLSSQFKPFPYSNQFSPAALPETGNMPDESSKTELHNTFAQVLSAQNKMLREIDKYNNIVASLKNKIDLLEGSGGTSVTSSSWVSEASHDRIKLSDINNESGGVIHNVTLSAATTTGAGVMTAAQAASLESAASTADKAWQQSNTNKTDIAAETAARKQGDADLLSQIDSTSKTLAEAITNEEQYRLTQDNALQSQITQNKTDISANAAAIAAHEQVYRDLGVYESETAARAALAALAVCADTTLGMAHFAYKADGTTYVSQMWQCLSYDVCRQVIYNRDKFYQRCIEFTSSARTAIKRVPNWDIAFCDRLVWDANANKYVPSMYGTKGKASINDAIPLATASRDGLMPRGYVTKVDTAVANIAANTKAVQTAQEGVDTNAAAISAETEARAAAALAEETARKQVDADLLSQIDSTSKTLTEAIANEGQYRQTQDNALQSQITQNKTDISANAAAIAAISKEQLFRDIWAAVGGKWAAVSGYTMNGLTLTYSEAVAVYAQTAGVWKSTVGLAGVGIYNSLDCRTNIPLNIPIYSKLINVFQLSRGIEVAAISKAYPKEQIDNCFNNCNSLVKVDGVLDLKNVSIFGYNFNNCPKLTYLRLLGLKVSADLSGAPALDYDSVRYLVDNATNTAVITVTVGDDLYAVINGTAQPTEARGGTAEEWAQLLADATQGQISFAKK